jgi:sulfur carrier protein
METSGMIIIKFNDQSITLRSAIYLNEFLMLHAEKNSIYAVSLNRKFIAKSNYSSILLHEGDHIELISPMQGG